MRKEENGSMKTSLTFWMMTAGTKQRQLKKAATPEKAEISGLVLTQLACLWESSLVELSAFSTRCMDANPYPRFHLENN